MESESRETGKGGLVSRFVEVEEVPNGFRISSNLYMYFTHSSMQRLSPSSTTLYIERG